MVKRVDWGYVFRLTLIVLLLIGIVVAVAVSRQQDGENFNRLHEQCLEAGGTWNYGSEGGRSIVWCSEPPSGR